MENFICKSPLKINVKLKNGLDSELYQQLYDFTKDDILSYKLYLLSKSPEFFEIYGNYEGLQNDPWGIKNIDLYNIQKENINLSTLEPTLNTILTYAKNNWVTFPSYLLSSNSFTNVSESF